MRDTGFTAKAVVDNGYLWTAGYTRDMKAARILRGAFSECAALKKVTLPKSAEVDDDVFAGTSAEIVRV